MDFVLPGKTRLEPEETAPVFRGRSCIVVEGEFDRHGTQAHFVGLLKTY